jgi:hypothetical protein
MLRSPPPDNYNLPMQTINESLATVLMDDFLKDYHDEKAQQDLISLFGTSPPTPSMIYFAYTSSQDVNVTVLYSGLTSLVLRDDSRHSIVRCGITRHPGIPVSISYHILT